MKYFNIVLTFGLISGTAVLGAALQNQTGNLRLPTEAQIPDFKDARVITLTGTPVDQAYADSEARKKEFYGVENDKQLANWYARKVSQDLQDSIEKIYRLRDKSLDHYIKVTLSGINFDLGEISRQVVQLSEKRRVADYSSLSPDKILSIENRFAQEEYQLLRRSKKLLSEMRLYIWIQATMEFIDGLNSGIDNLILVNKSGIRRLLTGPIQEKFESHLARVTNAFEGIREQTKKLKQILLDQNYISLRKQLNEIEHRVSQLFAEAETLLVHLKAENRELNRAIASEEVLEELVEAKLREEDKFNVRFS